MSNEQDAPEPEQPDTSSERLRQTFVRPERESDYPKIDSLVRSAFARNYHNEAELVEGIRNSPGYRPDLSFVADKGGKVVGHIMLSHLDLDDNGERHQVLTLSPVSVSPEEQGKGVGSELITTAIQAADEAGEPVIVLEGSPKYYPRFGFRPAAEIGISIDLPSWAPPEAAQAIPLSNYDPNIRGKVIYPPAFEVAES